MHSGGGAEKSLTKKVVRPQALEVALKPPTFITTFLVRDNTPPDCIVIQRQPRFLRKFAEILGPTRPGSPTALHPDR